MCFHRDLVRSKNEFTEVSLSPCLFVISECCSERAELLTCFVTQVRIRCGLCDGSAVRLRGRQLDAGLPQDSLVRGLIRPCV